MADREICPHCPEPYTWNQESFANLGCFVAMLLPLLLFILMWLFLLFGLLLG